MAEALALRGRAPQDRRRVETNASGSTVADLLEVEGDRGCLRRRARPVPHAARGCGSVKPEHRVIR